MWGGEPLPPAGGSVSAPGEPLPARIRTTAYCRLSYSSYMKLTLRSNLD